jgi:hypothetical protein
VPARYQENLTQTPGSAIGLVRGTVILRSLGEAQVAISGTVVVDDRTKDDYVNPAKNRCAPGLHSAVWVLDVTIAGVPFRVPIFVDDVTTVPGVSATMQLCLAGPVGTPNGTQLLSASFAVTGVFTNPSSAGVYRWSGIFTPYAPGTPSPNPPGTVEGRALVPLPVSLAIKANKKATNVSLTGKVNIPGGFLPARVEIWAGGSVSRLRRAGSAAVNTSTLRFKTTRRAPKKRFWFYQARVSIPPSTSDAIRTEACRGPSQAPRGCVSGTMTAIEVRSNVVRVRLRRR